jgi:hypothetical protein
MDADTLRVRLLADKVVTVEYVLQQGSGEQNNILG